jgi:hypothetical protein
LMLGTILARSDRASERGVGGDDAARRTENG